MAIRKVAIAAAMEQTRERTLRLMDLVTDEFLKVRVHDFYSPIGWHFGHIGMTEEHWTRCRALGMPQRDERLSFLYANLPENPKDNRVYLPERREIRAFLAATRRDSLDALAAADIDSPYPLLADGYAWEFALQHELQHQETITEMLQLIHQKCGACDLPAPAPDEPWAEPEMAPVPGGEFCMGSDDRHGYDNEKEAHRVRVAAFELERTPVTAAAWRRFIREGGYKRRELWNEAGWAWRESEGADRPEYWLTPEGRHYFGPAGVRPIRGSEPVSCVSWYEADAYARWAEKRLPTEAEWEYAARFDPATGGPRLYPWGDEPPDETRASFWLNEMSPSPVCGHPSGASAFGLQDMAGGVWEWTATPFLPYPGFEAYPYDGYSKDHMDGRHYVCRGGSFATSGRILRSSFRNWYVPTYRQGFLGIRCAR